MCIIKKRAPASGQILSKRRKKNARNNSSFFSNTCATGSLEEKQLTSDKLKLEKLPSVAMFEVLDKLGFSDLDAMRRVSRTMQKAVERDKQRLLAKMRKNTVALAWNYEKIENGGEWTWMDCITLEYICMCACGESHNILPRENEYRFSADAQVRFVFYFGKEFEQLVKREYANMVVVQQDESPPLIQIFDEFLSSNPLIPEKTDASNDFSSNNLFRRYFYKDGIEHILRDCINFINALPNNLEFIPGLDPRGTEQVQMAIEILKQINVDFTHRIFKLTFVNYDDVTNLFDNSKWFRIEVAPRTKLILHIYNFELLPPFIVLHPFLRSNLGKVILHLPVVLSVSDLLSMETHKLNLRTDINDQFGILKNKHYDTAQIAEIVEAFVSRKPLDFWEIPVRPDFSLTRFVQSRYPDARRVVRKNEKVYGQKNAIPSRWLLTRSSTMWPDSLLFLRPFTNCFNRLNLRISSISHIHAEFIFDFFPTQKTSKTLN